jgi:hypothetical protein
LADVRYWHLADIRATPANVHYWGVSGNVGPVMIPNERHDENEEGIGISDLSTLILDFFVFFFAAFFSAFAAVFNSLFFLPIDPSRSRVTASMIER